MFAGTKTTSKSEIMILDARPKINAFGNKFKGGGSEDASNYETVDTSCELEFEGLENIKVVRDSYDALLGICHNPQKYDSEKYYELIGGTKWLLHISKILKASCRVVECL